jgi:hypothetical protein
VQTFNSAQEAKEYLITQIILEAERERHPLSETERKMMYFSETAWTLPDIWKVNEAFEAEYDRPAYEAKIAALARKARDTVDEPESWQAAVESLQREDHYLLVLLSAPAGSSKSLAADRLKLLGTALLICILFIAVIFVFSPRK